MIKSVNAIILKTEKVSEAHEFYAALGLPLGQSDNEEGPKHYTCEIGPIHFAIYELDPWTGPERRNKTHDTMVGFCTENIEALMKTLDAMNVKVIIPVEETEQGFRAVVLDPDGRPVELSQVNKS